MVLDGLPVVRTYGPGSVSLPDVAAGPQKLVVYRNGDAQTIEVEVPDQGRVGSSWGGVPGDGSSSGLGDAEAEGPPPVLELRGAKGQRFSVILDGRRHSVLGPDRPARIEGLDVGPHSIELRSADNLTIWARGTVDLQLGDEVALGIQEGRPVEVFGRADAWQPSR